MSCKQNNPPYFLVKTLSFACETFLNLLLSLLGAQMTSVCVGQDQIQDACLHLNFKETSSFQMCLSETQVELSV